MIPVDILAQCEYICYHSQVLVKAHFIGEVFFNRIGAFLCVCVCVCPGVVAAKSLTLSPSFDLLL